MVIKKHYSDVKAENIEVPGAKNGTIRWLIAVKDGAENFALRLFEIAKDGHTPEHTHNWEHEIFVLEGEGMLISEDGDKPLKKGDFGFVPAMTLHQFRNTSEKTFKFLCVVPIKE